ncbi:4-hydroxyphenylpyruvate dioxygenase [Aphanothece hegewaldii CCALA 016]|uniref:4-hydroxyphenylpyruvate dioxygenase n=1 Tax=Aphanothece hegewaldii CCALA 016 TaxID=2107694 RepID=A0A2T1M0C3_9CHRO|nr:4-hydroxyphenylpyruvate dioxygenase [Aphanothece hegewaldii]PSF38102.1 4-hydroxyphenylpyruvate dioxygenase [Aphanothece hegewaldii CCALA 016]
MYIDYVHFYVEDAKKWRNWFVNVMGFLVIASGENVHTLTEVVGNVGNKDNSPIIFVLSSPLTLFSPVTKFLQKHPSGVVEIAFSVDDLEKIINNNAQIFEPIEERISSEGRVKWSQIKNPANLKHTLIERQGKTPIIPELNLTEIAYIPTQQSNFNKIDHLVLNVASGELANTANWYETVLEFEKKQSFRIQTEQSGLYSQVMVHPVSGVQIPINEPSSPNSQIQEFLDINQGSGIQHIALQTSKIVQLTESLRLAGLSFLKVPKNYYEQISNKNEQKIIELLELEALIKQEILIDLEIDHNLVNSTNYPLLLQIFTQPIFEKPTFFFELIERREQAKGFGEGNFRALFEAIEREQIKRGNLII